MNLNLLSIPTSNRKTLAFWASIATSNRKTHGSIATSNSKPHHFLTETFSPILSPPRPAIVPRSRCPLPFIRRGFAPASDAVSDAAPAWPSTRPSARLYRIWQRLQNLAEVWNSGDLEFWSLVSWSSGFQIGNPDILWFRKIFQKSFGSER